MQDIKGRPGKSGEYDEAVAAAVADGLSSKPKRLPSWLFYDRTGDALFQRIMRMPEYYPTRCEYDILRRNKEALFEQFARGSSSFNLIKLGAGDGLKTEILLGYFLRAGAAFTYMPIDISANVLEQLCGSLHSKYPNLSIRPVHERYDQAMASIATVEGRKVVLFMGANIGNFPLPEAVDFMRMVAANLTHNDLLLAGIDLKKNPRVIQEAYDDPRGLTREFNLNLLARLNRELGAEFALADFTHYPCYDPVSGITKSFLMSVKEQSVRIRALAQTIHFDAWEPIHTEVSQKYDVGMIEDLLTRSGFKAVQYYFDGAMYFCDVLATPR